MIEEVVTIFKDGAAELLPISGKPTNDNLGPLRELLRKLLQAIKVPGGTDAEGLKTTTGTTLAAPSTASTRRSRHTDPEIQSENMMNDRMQAKHEWTAKLLRQRLLRTAKCGACRLIPEDVKDTRVRRFKNATTYYNKPPP